MASQAQERLEGPAGRSASRRYCWAAGLPSIRAVARELSWPIVASPKRLRSGSSGPGAFSMQCVLPGCCRVGRRGSLGAGAEAGTLTGTAASDTTRAGAACRPGAAALSLSQRKVSEPPEPPELWGAQPSIFASLAWTVIRALGLQRLSSHTRLARPSSFGVAARNL